MKKVFIFGIAALALVLCGCRTQIVTVNVFPADATVIANGVEYKNKSPMFIEASTGKQLMITAYKEGYREKIHAIDYSLSTLGKIEAWTAIFILPAFGLFSDYAWELKENNVELVLEPISKEARKEAASSGLYGPESKYKYKPLDTTTDPKAKQAFSEL